MIEALRVRKRTFIYLAATLLAILFATQLGSRLNIMPIVLLGVISPMLLAIAFSYYKNR